MPKLIRNVLLLGLQPKLIESLEQSLKKLNVNPVSVSYKVLAKAEYHFELDKRTNLGWIKLKGTKINVSSFISSYAHQLPALTSSSTPFNQFQESEFAAFVGYLRTITGTTINPPSQGSVSSYCNSLIEQWESIRNANLDISVPSWETVTDTSTPEINNTETIKIYNIYDYSMRLCDDKSTNKNDLYIRVSIPRGAYCSCWFVGEKLIFAYAEQGHLVEFIPPETIILTVRQLIAFIYNAFNKCSVGTLTFSYLTHFEFWSVRPGFSYHGLSKTTEERQIQALAQLLVGN